jgi:hypothetical protein
MAADTGKPDGETPQWDGCVLDVDGDTFTAELQREGCVTVIADFSMTQCGITVEPGDVLIVKPDSVTKRDLGIWTQAEIDAIMRRARERSRRLRLIAERG